MIFESLARYYGRILQSKNLPLTALVTIMKNYLYKKNAETLIFTPPGHYDLEDTSPPPPSETEMGVTEELSAG